MEAFVARIGILDRSGKKVRNPPQALFIQGGLEFLIASCIYRRDLKRNLEVGSLRKGTLISSRRFLREVKGQSGAKKLVRR